MKIRNIQDLEKRKEQLKTEISNLEELLSFKNPRKSFEVITDGATEKYLGGILDSQIGKNILPLAGKFLGNSLKFGSAKLFSNVIKKKMTRSVTSKSLIGLGILVVAPFLIKKVKQEFDNYREKEATKSLSKLI